MKKVTQTAGKVFCEEFSNLIHEDFIHHSILVNVDHDWYPHLVTGMYRRGYKLVHATEMPQSVTAVFQRS